MTTIKVHNIETGEIIERDMTEQEIAVHEQLQNDLSLQAQSELAAIAARAALLEKLGITEEEAKLLLGGI